MVYTENNLRLELWWVEELLHHPKTPSSGNCSISGTGFVRLAVCAGLPVHPSLADEAMGQIDSKVKGESMLAQLSSQASKRCVAPPGVSFR